jgi:exodeoxyribonuclease VII small subunit
MNELSYEEALTELQTILQDLQKEQVSIDALSSKSERAEVLLAYCQEKLRNLNAKLAPKEDTPSH